MINEHATTFAGKPVREWNAEEGTIDPQFHYRISVDYDADADAWQDSLAAFLEADNVSQVTGLIVGNWGEVASGDDSAAVVEALTIARDKLPALTALFLGDLTMEESEISWIIQNDVSSLFSAYPNLEYFRARGGIGLRLGHLQHDKLKSLVIETGGMPVEIVREVAAAQLPALEHLELWLGTDNYGWNGTLEDIKPLLQSGKFPHLRYLGLRDSDIADEIATALADAPILQQLDTLDLSLGTLSDAGGEALLRNPAIRRLKKLDLHHHYLSDEMMSRFTGMAAPNAAQQPILGGIEPHLAQSPGIGIEVDVSGQEEEDDSYRYVAVGE